MRKAAIRFACAATLGFGVTACGGGGSTTEVMVVVNAATSVRMDSTALRVRVWGGADADAEEEERLDETMEAPDWPVRVALVPRGGDEARVFRVQATALDSGGLAVVTQSVSSSYVAGQILRLVLTLDDSCRSVNCVEPETCAHGSCGSSWTDPEDLRPYCADDGDCAGDGRCVLHACVCTQAEPCSAPRMPVSLWAGDGDATDSVGAYDGTTMGGVGYDAARVGSGFSFDGEDDGVTIAPADVFERDTEFSVAFWMKSAASQNLPQLVLVEKSHGPDPRGWYFSVDTDTGLLAWGFGDAVGWANVVTSRNTVLDGSWHFIVGTLDENLRLYIDGEEVRSLATDLTVAQNDLGINIGHWWGNGSPNRFFHGIIDEVAWYDVVLRADEVRALYVDGQ